MKQINVGDSEKRTMANYFLEKKADSLLTYYNNTTGAAAIMVVEVSFSVSI